MPGLFCPKNYRVLPQEWETAEQIPLLWRSDLMNKKVIQVVKQIQPKQQLLRGLSYL